MSTSFQRLCLDLRTQTLSHVSTHDLVRSLQKLSSTALPNNEQLVVYLNQLLCTRAYAPNEQVRQLVDAEMGRLSRHCKKLFRTKNRIPENEGLPWQPTHTAFSPAFLRWLTKHPHVQVELKWESSESTMLNDILSLSITPTLRSECTASLHNEALLEQLRVPQERHAEFLAQQLERFASVPALEDYLQEKLGVHMNLLPLSEKFSRAYNRLEFVEVFDHDSLLKKFDHEELIARPVSTARVLDAQQKAELIQCVKNSMALTARETDPATFMDETSLRFYELERGISVCLYGITDERQLPLESYIGYSLFKNGLPCAYGGAWVFGPHANFGINIHEAFRGGESGFVLCQLLRVYTQIFQLQTIEVEAFQYGLDNPEGISSAAFWFYYRYGFKPIDKKLATIAETEQRKMKLRKGYRSSARTLRAFTQSNMIRKGRGAKTLRVADITTRILKLIATRYKNNDSLAEEMSRAVFLQHYPEALGTALSHTRHFTELALWAHSANIHNSHQLELMAQMSRLKSEDQYRYQEKLRECIGCLVK